MRSITELAHEPKLRRKSARSGGSDASRTFGWTFESSAIELRTSSALRFATARSQSLAIAQDGAQHTGEADGKVSTMSLARLTFAVVDLWRQHRDVSCSETRHNVTYVHRIARNRRRVGLEKFSARQLWKRFSEYVLVVRRAEFDE